jgi:hypothetical protein
MHADTTDTHLADIAVSDLVPDMQVKMQIARLFNLTKDK